MKRILAAFVTLVICLAAVSCGTEPPKEPEPTMTATVVSPLPQAVPAPVSLEVREEEPELQYTWECPEGLKLSLLQEDYPIWAEQVTLVMENAGELEMGISNYLSFQKFVDGEWQEIDFLNRMYFRDYIVICEPHSVRTQTIRLNTLREALGEGLYRVTGGTVWLEQEEAAPSWQLDFCVTADAQPEPDYALYIPGQPVSAFTERLPVKFINTTGKDYCLVDIPCLECWNEEGEWEKVPCKEGVGFCGTPDPLPAEGRDSQVALSALWEALEPGQYRLSYQVGDLETGERIYAEFEVCEAEICGYPLAEDFQAKK